MGKTIANNKHIRISKSFFGLSESIVYEPTSSRVRLIRNDYEQTDGARIQRLLALPVEKMSREMTDRGIPKSKAIGNYRLEGAVSDDRRFVALQLFQFSDFRYHPVCDPIFYEGEMAEVVSKLVD
ncbi:MAG: hypothetical protein IJ844_05455, partial [Prevotella sp.]|nr:hypothetical protein [Prevotella sp.]